MASIALGGQAIRAAVREREIPYLVHFTRAANLPDILKHGIVPIAGAQGFGVNPLINDELRLDDCPDASSLSIGFPNAPMFFKYRCRTGDREWVVLEVDPAVLWSKPSLFCAQNAACALMRRQSREERASVEAFHGMFDEVVGPQMRQGQVLQRFDPTDVQAEVLVVDVIEPRFIRAAVFSDPLTRVRYLPAGSELRSRLVRPGQDFFATRSCARTHG